MPCLCSKNLTLNTTVEPGQFTERKDPIVGGRPLPLRVWDREAGKLIQEFMDDHPATYDSRPRRSVTQWLESRRAYDWLIAAYQNSRWSARQIEPFISKHHIDMSEFKPVIFRSFAEFFGREFRPGVRE